MGYDDELDEATMGIWADSEAIRAMQNMHTRQTEDGLVMRRTCEQCQLEVPVRLPWSEVYVVSCGLFPQQLGQRNLGWFEWRYNKLHRTMHPVVMCPKCAGSSKPCLVMFGLSPNDAHRYFEAAYKGNVISEGQLGIIRQLPPLIERVKASLAQVRR